MSVIPDTKLDVLAGMFRPLMGALAAGPPSGEVGADDIINFFALGIAAVIENDSHLTTAALRTEAVKTAAQHIAYGVATMSAYRDRHGQSFLLQVLEQPGAADTVN